MITRQLELPERVERQIQLASAAYRMTGTDFIYAAIHVALDCSAEEIPAIAKAFALVPAV
jgi:hypothetical protein